MPALLVGPTKKGISYTKIPYVPPPPRVFGMMLSFNKIFIVMHKIAE
jgi:hypothetical protein